MIDFGNRRLPYPGLRSFRKEESDLFFGREDCINDMVDRLARTRFLAVLGSSGSGKSSLVKTGLLDALEIGVMAEAGSRWSVIDFRPGSEPLKSLAEALIGPEGAEADIGLTREFLTRGPRSIIEWCRDGHLPEGRNLLLLVDQFEELFRYRDYAGREEAEAFVALLIDSARAKELPIYVVLTMRSEYLNACALIDDLAQTMNAGQFLTPRLTREQCRRAIVEPAKVCGVEIEDGLVNQLLNDVADFAPWDDSDHADQLDRIARRADQLPVLQHALNQLWVRSYQRNPDAPVALKLADYRAIGGLQGAINTQANEILTQLGNQARPTAERVFRALTAGSTVAEAVRRPTSFAELVSICDGEEAGVRAVIEAFRAPGCDFLVPEPDVPLEPETVVDISHESLIRQWKQLSAWHGEEVSAAHSWQRLKEAVANYRRREGGLLQGLDLDTLLRWRDHAHPNAAWARRYGGDYDEAFGFLARSAKASRNRRFAGLAGVVAALAIIGSLGYLMIDRSRTATEKESLLAEQERTRDAELRAETALSTLHDNITQTVRSSLAAIAAKTQGYQADGNWNAAWNLLGHYVGELAGGLQSNPADRQAAEPVYLRLLEQEVQADRPIELAMELSGRRVTKLTTGDWSRLGLLSTGSGYSLRLYLVDKLTGAIIGRSNILGRLGDSDSIRDKNVTDKDTGLAQFVSDDGQHAVIIFDSGKVVHWNLANGTFAEILFRKEKDVSYRLLKQSDISSIALERTTGRAALIIKPANGPRQIVVSLSEEGLEGPEIPLSPLSNLFEPANPTSDKSKLNDPEFDLDSGNLLTFVGRQLIVELRHKERKDGLVAVDLSSDTKSILVSSAAFPSLSRVATDERLIFSVHLCLSPDGNLMWLRDRACLTALDRSSGSPIFLTQIPADSEIRQISSLPASPPDSRGYGILIKAAGASRRLTVSAGDGRAPRLLEDGQGWTDLFPDRIEHLPARGLRTERLPVSGTWPPLVETSSLARGRSGAVFASIGVSNDLCRLAEGPDASILCEFRLTVTNYTADQSGLGISPNALLLRQLGSANLGFYDRDSRVRAVFGEDDKLVLLLADFVPKQAEPTQPEPTQPEPKQPQPARRRLNAAMVAVDKLAGFGGGNGPKWVPLALQTDSCRTAVPTNFADIRYWGRQPNPKTAGASPVPSFIGIDTDGQLWKVAVLGGIENPEVTIECIGAPLNGNPKILAVDDKRGDAVIQSASIYIYSRDAGRTTIELPELPAAAAFLASSRLAFVLRNGDILLAERTGTDAWSVKPALRSVVSSARLLASDGADLLAVATGGYAVDLRFDGDTLRPVAVGLLPAPPERNTVYDLSFNAGARTVDVIMPGTVERFRLDPLPTEDQNGPLVVGRGLPIEKSERESTDLLTTLMGGVGSATPGAKPLVSIDTAGECQLAIEGLLSLQEATFLGDSPPVERLRSAQSSVRMHCGLVEGPSAARSGLAREASVILDVMRGDPAHRTSGWPPEWSSLLRAAEQGDSLALQALVFALKTSGDPKISEIASVIWKRLGASHAILPRADTEDIFAGASVSADLARILTSKSDAIDPNLHLLIGYSLERAMTNVQTLGEALFHFWIAEELFRVSGRSQEEALASTRRGMLARALPDETVQTARKEVAEWHGRIVMAAESAPDIATPGDEAARLARDVASLGTIAERLPDPKALDLLRVVLLWSLADAQAAANSTEARETYARMLDTVAKLSLPTQFVVPLDGLSKKLAALGDHQLAMISSTEALTILESGQSVISGADELRSYQDALMSLRSVLDGNESLIDELPGLLNFNRYLLGYASARGGNAAQQALDEKLKLLDALLGRRPEVANWIEQRATTKFWLAVNASDDASKSKDPATQAQDKSREIDFLDKAIRDYQSLAASGTAGPDLSYLEADALRWRVSDSSGQKKVDLLAQARQRYLETVASFERGDWKLPGPVTEADLYAEYAEILEKLSDQVFDTLFNDQDRWDPQRPDIQAVFWDSFISGRQWELARRHAELAGATWGTRLSRNTGPAYAMALLGGHLRLVGNAHEATRCDEMASAPFDPFRRSSSVLAGQIKVEDAEPACKEALASLPHNRRFEYLSARVADIKGSGMTQEELGYYVDAASQDYPAAFNNIFFYIEHSPGYGSEGTNGVLHDLAGKFRHAFTQRVLLSSFGIAYEFLKRYADNEDRRQALQWLTDQAAQVGSADGHAALADFATTDAEKWFHLQLAANLMDKEKNDRHEEAAALRARAAALGLAEDEIQRQQQRVETWEQADPLIAIPPDLLQRLTEASQPAATR